ncbi:hypothetical protein C8R46DRAFT_1201589 [Mycena filopes]|nr:hypothetical protein C8R46DRAFT_1201589 [Mycena filopes]
MLSSLEPKSESVEAEEDEFVEENPRQSEPKRSDQSSPELLLLCVLDISESREDALDIESMARDRMSLSSSIGGTEGLIFASESVFKTSSMVVNEGLQDVACPPLATESAVNRELKRGWKVGWSKLQPIHDRFCLMNRIRIDYRIGDPYHGTFTPAIGQWKVVPVRMFEAAETSRFHVILARPPPSWNATTEETPFKNISTAGFTTTFGPASFFEPMQNKPDVEELLSLIHPGQPRKTQSNRKERANLGVHGTSGKMQVNTTRDVVNIVRVVPSCDGELSASSRQLVPAHERMMVEKVRRE